VSFIWNVLRTVISAH